MEKLEKLFKGELKVVLQDGTSAILKNVSVEALSGFKKWARGEKVILEAYRDGKFFDVKINDIKSWGDFAVKAKDQT